MLLSVLQQLENLGRYREILRRVATGRATAVS